MKNIRRVILGVVLIALGVVFALNAFGITSIDLFFEGWWTLFIIVPCSISLFTEKDKIGSVIGILIGVALLLCARDVWDFDVVVKLIIPILIVIAGLKLIFGSVFNRGKSKVAVATIEIKGDADGTGDKDSCTAIFSGNEFRADGREFDGAELNAIFGGVDFRLENAVFTKDVTVNATAIFGGVDIFVPDNVRVEVRSTSIFGGASNKAKDNVGEHTLYVNATSIFGGVDIKRSVE